MTMTITDIMTATVAVTVTVAVAVLRRRASLAIAVGLMAVVPAVTQAQSSDRADRIAPISGSATPVVDPERGYILVEATDQVNLTFFRAPDAAERAAFLGRRATEFAEVHRRYERQRAQWERNQARATPCSASAIRNGTCVNRVRPAPVEPLDATFVLRSQEFDATFTVGPQNRFSRGDGRSVYLTTVRPGRYVFYGAFPVLAPVAGQCVCFGTVAFEVRAGQVTDLGVAGPGAPGTFATADGAGTIGSFMFRPADRAALPLDPRLANATVVMPQFEAVGKLPNFFGNGVDRVSATDGVISYRRDRILDAAGRDVTDAYGDLMRQTPLVAEGESAPPPQLPSAVPVQATAVADAN